MVRNRDVFSEAEILRKNGKSYSEIRSELGIAKSTLSDWFSKKEWSKSIKTGLTDIQLAKSRVRLLLMNKARMVKKIARDKKYQKEADLLYRKMKRNPLFVAGLSIYWGEGEKFGTGRISVINTDAGMMGVMINFYRKVLKIPERKIRVGLFVYEDLDPVVTKKYWACMLNLSDNQFIKTHILPSKGKPGKKRSAYGMCNIYVCSTELKLKMIRWIKTFSSEYAKLI